MLDICAVEDGQVTAALCCLAKLFCQAAILTRDRRDPEMARVVVNVMDEYQQYVKPGGRGSQGDPEYLETSRSFLAVDVAATTAFAGLPKSGNKVPRLSMSLYGTTGAVISQISFGEALFSGTRQRVLGILFGQPQRDYTISELIALAASGSGAVQREVRRLLDSGLVTVRLVGRQKRYQACSSSPIFDELCSIIRKTQGPAQQVKTALMPIEDRIELALLYGSVAKQTDRADSDIDILVVSDTLTLEEVLSAIGPAESSLGRTIQPTLYTSEEFDSRRAGGSPFLRKVLGGEYIVLKGALDG